MRHIVWFFPYQGIKFRSASGQVEMKQNVNKPTLQDVARKAGVSTATVSRCLNFPDQVAGRTQEKVNNAVRELGYSPDFGAKAMAARRTNTIGAIIPTMANALFARGLQAFQEELQLHGFTTLVASTSYSSETEEQQIRSLVARGADGLLLIGHERDPEIYRFLETQGVPVLISWVYDTAATRPSVGFDNAAAMKEMANEVISLGHRQIALISAELEFNDRATARLHGIQDAMSEAGLDASNLQVVETYYGIDEGAVAFDELMKTAKPPTAVLCGNDVLAVGALRRARELDIKVPEQVSIIGFDDLDLARATFPALTTVLVPHREMGKQAAIALASKVKDDAPIQSYELKTKLVFRDTLGPVL